LAGAFTYHAGGGSGGSLSMILGSLKGHGTALSNGGTGYSGTNCFCQMILSTGNDY
jgi:hypothetical protein